MIWSGFATAAILAAGFAYFAIFAFSGGLQTVLETDAPPSWALTELEVLSAIIVLYLLGAVVLTVSLAVVQFQIGPWWAVVGGLCALVAGAGLLVAGSLAGSSMYAIIDTLGFVGFAGYMVSTNVVGVRARQLNALMAGAGVASTLLLLAATLTRRPVGVGFLALALLALWRLGRLAGHVGLAAAGG